MENIDLKYFAEYYRELGFRIQAMDPFYLFNYISNDFEGDPYKQPIWFRGVIETNDYFNTVKWESATGVGVILGAESLNTIALDLDDWTYHDCSIENDPQIDSFLSILGLPQNYEWVTITGSGRCVHIIVCVPEINLWNLGGSIAFCTKEFCHFKKVELRCDGAHLVLPPSLHKSGSRYHFRSRTLPSALPQEIDPGNVFELLAKYCLPLKESFPIGVRQEPLLSHVMESKEYELFPSDSWFQPTVTEFGLLYSSSNEYAKNRQGVKYCEKGLWWIGTSFLRSGGSNLISYNNGVVNNYFLSRPTIKTYNSDYFLVFDTETTGLREGEYHPMQYDKWPRLVQLGWVVLDRKRNMIEKECIIIKPDGFTIPEESTSIHKITDSAARQNGMPLPDALDYFLSRCYYAHEIVGHNLEFDLGVIFAELYRLGIPTSIFVDKYFWCTMKAAVRINPSKKYPKLEELYRSLFGHEYHGAHNALIDAIATAECYRSQFNHRVSFIPLTNTFTPSWMRRRYYSK